MSLRAIVGASPANHGRDFALIAKALLAAPLGSGWEAASAAARDWTRGTTKSLVGMPSERALAALREKTAVQPGGYPTAIALEDSQYSGAANAFLGTLSHASAFDAVVGSMMQCPLRARYALVSAAGTASVVSFGSLKPVTNLSFTTDTVNESKIVAVVALSRELARFGGTVGETATAIIQAELTKAVSKQVDVEFIRRVVANVSPLTASGLNAFAARRDIGRALAAMTLSAGSRLYIITAPAMVAALASQSDSTGNSAWPGLSPSGGTMLGIPVLPCDAMASDEVMVLDASQCVGSAGTIDIRQGAEADVIMDGAPDSPPTTGTIVLNLWQRNLGAVLVERMITCELVGSTGCQLISSSSYGNSPAPP